MGLNDIDISSWQEDLVVSAMTTCDFVIVKATGGAGYSNECFRRHADETLSCGNLLGCYHYARDRGYEGSAEAEADWFIAAFKPYVGKAIPFLDWEADALNLGPAWAKKWLDRVRDKTGVTPGIYTSKSVLFSYDWAAVAKTYPLWVAQYPNYEASSVKQSPQWGDCSEKAQASSLRSYEALPPKPGDQTGRESWVHDYYSGHWDGILHYNGKADVGSASTPTGSGAPSGDVSELAARVIAGEFGNGTSSVKQTPQCGVCSEKARAFSERTSRPLGSRYDEVQAEVNRILLGGSSGGSYDVDALARRVIAGEFGNGDERRRRLGDKYSAVQRRVNEILGASGASSTSMDVDAMARSVIRGDYGNGDERKRRLGPYYSVVQRRVNEMLS